MSGGGGSSSSSSSSQSTQNIDRRLVVGEGAIGFSSDGGSYTVNVSDQNAIAAARDATLGALYLAQTTDAQAKAASREAVAAALNLVQASDQETGKSLSSVLGFAKEVFMSGLTVLDKAGVQIEQQTDLISKAYDNAQGEGTQKNYIAAAALATVAIVAVKVWGK